MIQSLRIKKKKNRNLLEISNLNVKKLKVNSSSELWCFVIQKQGALRTLYMSKNII